jgi:hypothetical protein
VVPALSVAGWLWTTTTAVGAVVSVTLLGFLGADVLATAISAGDRSRTRGGSAIRCRLERVAIVLAVCFVAVVSARFVLILVEHHGP